MSAVPAVRQPQIAAPARAVQADLMVLAPEIPPECGPLWLDPQAVRVAAQADRAVLVFRDTGRWPPRKVLLPLVEADVPVSTLSRAADWLDTSFGAPGPDFGEALPELHVLRAAADMDGWYGMNGAMEAELGALTDRGRHIRLQDCMRFGTEPSRRILRWTRRESPDLLILGRHTAAGPQRRGSARAWLRVLSGSLCPVLLLPPRSSPARPPGETNDAFPWRRAGGWWRRGITRDLLPSA